MLFGMDGVEVTEAEHEAGGRLTVWAMIIFPPACPGCRTVSERVHQYVTTRPRDVRACGQDVHFFLIKRRRECAEENCATGRNMAVSRVCCTSARARMEPIRICLRSVSAETGRLCRRRCASSIRRASVSNSSSPAAPARLARPARLAPSRLGSSASASPTGLFRGGAEPPGSSSPSDRARLPPWAGAGLPGRAYRKRSMPGPVSA